MTEQPERGPVVRGRYRGLLSPQASLLSLMKGPHVNSGRVSFSSRGSKLMQLPVEEELCCFLAPSSRHTPPLAESVPYEHAQGKDRQDGCQRNDQFSVHLPAPPQRSSNRWDGAGTRAVVAVSYPISPHSKHRFPPAVTTPACASRSSRAGQPVGDVDTHRVHDAQPKVRSEHTATFTARLRLDDHRDA